MQWLSIVIGIWTTLHCCALYDLSKINLQWNLIICEVQCYKQSIDVYQSNLQMFSGLQFYVTTAADIYTYFVWLSLGGMVLTAPSCLGSKSFPTGDHFIHYCGESPTRFKQLVTNSTMPSPFRPPCATMTYHLAIYDMIVTICDVVAIWDDKCRDLWWVSGFVTKIVSICDDVKICSFTTCIDSNCIDKLFIQLTNTNKRLICRICPYINDKNSHVLWPLLLTWFNFNLSMDK